MTGSVPDRGALLELSPRQRLLVLSSHDYNETGRVIGLEAILRDPARHHGQNAVAAVVQTQTGQEWLVLGYRIQTPRIRNARVVGQVESGFLDSFLVPLITLIGAGHLLKPDISGDQDHE